MAKKEKSVFVCDECGYKTPKWMGKCPECNSWNSFSEEVVERAGVRPVDSGKRESSPQRIQEIEKAQTMRIPSGIGEFDRVMGGGIVPGSLVLIGGEPGVGKSTLLSHVVYQLSLKSKEPLLYISGEESPEQVALRSQRLGTLGDNIYILHETSWEKMKKHIRKLSPSLVVLDSVQTTVSQEIASPPGTVSQVREVTYELMNEVKSRGITGFIIGHVTKSGQIAGPKILEHMVDSVIYFEGDSFNHYRILRSIKNRFGNTHEVGIFEMNQEGLREVSSASECFLEEGIQDSYGNSLTAVLEGTRTIFVEVQALVVENKFGNGRRTSEGVDQSRLSMLVAIAEKYLEYPLSFNDIYLNIVGGLKIKNRDTDLAILAALMSSHLKKPLPDKTLFLGEVGLTGEVRSIPFIEQRLKDIEAYGYKKIITSSKIAKEYKKNFSGEIIGLKKVDDLLEAIES